MYDKTHYNLKKIKKNLKMLFFKLKGEKRMMQAYIKKQENSQINNLLLHRK